MLILKKIVNIFLLAFYSLGTFFLPLGDFSTLKDIPEMYRHCKATEDKDMTAFDFITDHLINIDGLFDKHQNGDDQKPHQPISNQHYGQKTYTCNTYFSFSLKLFPLIEVKPFIHNESIFNSNNISKVFRPPIV